MLSLLKMVSTAAAAAAAVATAAAGLLYCVLVLASYE
jgi:hypothetical protein